MPTGNPWLLRVCCEKAAAASAPPAKGIKRRREIFLLLRMCIICFIIRVLGCTCTRFRNRARTSRQNALPSAAERTSNSLDSHLLVRFFGDRGSGEVARHAEGLYFDGSYNLAWFFQGGRVDEGNRRAAVIRFILPSSVVSVDGAGNRDILLLRIAGSGDLVVSHSELAFLVALVSGDDVMDGPLARQVLRCERRRCKQEGRCCEKSFHRESPFGFLVADGSTLL
jgi:hypothetical protein